MIDRLAVALLASALAAAPLSAGAEAAHPARAIVESGEGTALAAVELWFRAPSEGFGDTRVGIAQLAAEMVAASAGHQEPFAALVQDRGGTLTITAFSDSVQISAVVPAAYAAEIAQAALADYTRPTVTEDGFKRAQAAVAIEAALAQGDPDAQLRAHLFGSLFSQGPDHYAAIPTMKELGLLTYPETLAFAKRAFRAQNAIAVVVGVSNNAPILSALGGAASGDPAEAAALSVPVSTPSATRTTSAAGPAFGMAFAGPPIADRRAATAMDFLSDYLLAPRDGAVSRALHSIAPTARVGGQFITLHDPGIFLVEVSGVASTAASDAVERVLQSVQRPLDPRAFAIARRAYIYHLLRDLQTTQAQADNLGWYAVEGSPAYAPFAGGGNGEYLKIARSLTPEFVAQVARKYLARRPAVATLMQGVPAAQEGAAR